MVSRQSGHVRVPLWAMSRQELTGQVSARAPRQLIFACPAKVGRRLSTHPKALKPDRRLEPGTVVLLPVLFAPPPQLDAGLESGPTAGQSLRARWQGGRHWPRY